MTWFKVDDTFHSNRKVMSLMDEPEALGLWVIAGSWCGSNLTNGFVPDYALARLLPDAVKLAQKLVTAGLWTRVRGGHRFHDWDHYQLTAEEILEERAAARERMRRLRARRRGDKQSIADR